MHISRSEAAERISGKSEAGHIYNYKELEAGQIFCGEILGDKDSLKNLQLENNFFVECIGRSRFTQYGKYEFNFSKIEEIKYKEVGEKFSMRLESPLLSANDNFISTEKILQTEIIEKLGGIFSL